MTTKFFTNSDENNLIQKFEGVLTYNPNIQYFDALVGYFRASGYFRIRPFLDKVPNIRILVGINIDKMLADAQKEGLELFTKKNIDYGDAFAKYGPIGTLIRINDKISRLQSITKNGITLINDESIRDTLIDLHNYSAMTIMLIDEQRQKNEPNITNTINITNCIDFKDINRY